MEKESIKYLLGILEKCKGTIQGEKWHPEGSVYNHSIQTFDTALKNTKDKDIIIAALFHDLGKLMESRGHEKYSVMMCDGHVSEKTLWLIENHMRMHLLLEGKMKKESKIKKLLENPWFSQLSDLANYDKNSRNKDYNYSMNYMKWLKEEFNYAE